MFEFIRKQKNSSISNLLEPYNENWKTEFVQLKITLLAELYGLNVDIQHVGSTAVPNLVAKPILDVDIIIEDKNLIVEISKRLVKIGYLSRGEQGISGRFVFKQTSNKTPQTQADKIWQEHHLYVCFLDSLALKNHLLFRDSLLKDTSLVEKYTELKNTLVNQSGMTREQYSKLKTKFILSVLSDKLSESELRQIHEANL